MLWKLNRTVSAIDERRENLQGAMSRKNGCCRPLIVVRLSIAIWHVSISKMLIKKNRNVDWQSVVSAYTPPGHSSRAARDPSCVWKTCET